MKKIVIAAVCFVTSAFAEQLVLDNQTSYPAKNQKIAIQWASSAQEVDASNKALLAGEKFSPAHLQALKQTGKIDLTIPKNTAYFRLVAWSKEGKAPDLSTNWIEFVPGTTYTLKTDHLVPVVLMLGTGC